MCKVSYAVLKRLPVAPQDQFHFTSVLVRILIFRSPGGLSKTARMIKQIQTFLTNEDHFCALCHYFVQNVFQFTQVTQRN